MLIGRPEWQVLYSAQGISVWRENNEKLFSFNNQPRQYELPKSNIKNKHRTREGCNSKATVLMQLFSNT